MNLGLELINFLVNTFLLSSIHLRLIMQVGSWVVPALWSIFSSRQTALDLSIDLAHHLRQLLDQLILILALVAFPLSIIDELVFEEIVVAFFTRPNVRLRVREQIIWAERQ